MDNKSFELSEMQQDLLTELFNLGIGSAANSLSQLVNQEVVLSVPSILFETQTQLTQRLGRNEDIFSVSQEMEGPFAMQSMLIFNPEDSFDVVKQMLGEHLSDETLAELQSEALSEIGNIVLNACISVIAEALGEKFLIQLPVFRDTKAAKLLNETMDHQSDLLLSILVKMELLNNEINGHLIFILNADSMSNLFKTLNSVLESYE